MSLLQPPDYPSFFIFKSPIPYISFDSVSTALSDEEEIDKDPVAQGGGKIAQGDGWSAAVKSSQQGGSHVPMKIHDMAAPVMNHPGMVSSFWNPMLSGVPIMNANPMMGNAMMGINTIMGSFQSVQPGLGQLPAFSCHPSYGVGMNQVASAGFGVPTSGMVVQVGSG